MSALLNFQEAGGPTADNLVEYLLCAVFLLCGRKALDVIPALKGLRLPWGRQMGTKDITVQTSLDQVTRDSKCCTWGIINVCVEAVDLGLCGQLPYGSVRLHGRAPTPSGFLLPWHVCPAFWQPCAGEHSWDPRAIYRRDGVHKARYEMWARKTYELKNQRVPHKREIE